MKIELSDFTGQPCKSRIAYEFIPKKNYSLDLKKTAEKLKKENVFIEIETPYLIMLKHLGKNVSLFKSGKIIVKSVNEKNDARKIAESLIKKIN